MEHIGEQAKMILGGAIWVFVYRRGMLSRVVNRIVFESRLPGSVHVTMGVFDRFPVCLRSK